MLKFLNYFMILISFNVVLGDSRPSHFCMSVRPQKVLDIDKILGKWYGSDIIEHSGSITDPGIYYYDTCAEISITNVRFANFDNRKYVRIDDDFMLMDLFWEEHGYKYPEATAIEYKLQFNRSTPGLWLTADKQRGYFPSMKYNQFNGTIQVVKAVKDQLVLTFCNLKLGESFFSVILTRDLQPLPFEDRDDIYILLKRRGLSTDHVRRVCHTNPNHSNFAATFSGFLLLFLIFLIFIIN